MNMTETSLPNVILSGKKLSWARAGLLTLAVLMPLFLATNIWAERFVINDISSNVSKSYQILAAYNEMIKWIGEITLFLSWVLGVILLSKKPSEGGPILVILMFLSRAGSGGLWILLFMGINPEVNQANFLRLQLANAMSVPFTVLAELSLIAVLLTFPTGRFHNRFARWLFWFALVTEIYFSLVSLGIIAMPILEGIPLYVSIYYKPLLQLLAGLMLFVGYRAMPNSEQRQKIKWIVVFFVLSICAIIFGYIMPGIILFIGQYGFFSDFGFEGTVAFQMTLAILVPALIDLAIVIAFGISIFRYRLWDVDIFINHALVYTSLTVVLSGLTILSITLVDYFIKQWVGDESSIWGVLVSLLPAAGAFNPLRDRLQAWVDLRFKPEEVDFSATFIEFNPSVRERLTPETILQTVSRQVAKQLELDHARIYLEQSDGQLFPALSDTPSAPPLDENQLASLRVGELVVPESGGNYSLLVPLLVPRARFPDFLGCIVLGQRLNGKGYSTPILENLKTLGSEAGTAIYLSTITAPKANDAVQAG